MKSRIRRLSYQGRRRWQGMLFVLPLMIGLLLFGVIPLIRALVFSFCELKVTADGYTAELCGRVELLPHFCRGSELPAVSAGMAEEYGSESADHHYFLVLCRQSAQYPLCRENRGPHDPVFADYLLLRYCPEPDAERLDVLRAVVLLLGRRSRRESGIGYGLCQSDEPNPAEQPAGAVRGGCGQPRFGDYQYGGGAHHHLSGRPADHQPFGV